MNQYIYIEFNPNFVVWTTEGPLCEAYVLHIKGLFYFKQKGDNTMANGQDVQWISKPTIGGEVVHEMKAGRKLRFPMANLSQSPDSIENGIYGMQAQFGN